MSLRREGIKPERLAAEIQRQLREYTEEVKENVWDTAMNVSEKAVTMLKEQSPKRTGDYAKNWTRTEQRGGMIVHNKDTYRITHLIEKGHQLIRGGRKIGTGWVNAHPYIAKIEEQCVKEYVEEVERRLGG